MLVFWRTTSADSSAALSSGSFVCFVFSFLFFFLLLYLLERCWLFHLYLFNMILFETVYSDDLRLAGFVY